MTRRSDLDARLLAWKKETARLPSHLVELPPRVRHALRSAPSEPAWGRGAPRALALAASLALAALALGVLLTSQPAAPSGGIDIVGGEALSAIVSAQAAFERGAQRNEPRALSRLARADHPDTPALEASELAAMRDRLERLERRIERSEEFLELNPYHAPARLALLRAHEGRDELLSRLAAGPRMRG